MMPLQKTCTCIEDLVFNDYRFRKRREYQVDVYPLYYKIYNNGGWDDYIFIDSYDYFNKYFKMID